MYSVDVLENVVNEDYSDILRLLQFIILFTVTEVRRWIELAYV